MFLVSLESGIHVSHNISSNTDAIVICPLEFHFDGSSHSNQDLGTTGDDLEMDCLLEWYNKEILIHFDAFIRLFKHLSFYTPRPFINCHTPNLYLFKCCQPSRVHVSLLCLYSNAHTLT